MCVGEQVALEGLRNILQSVSTHDDDGLQVLPQRCRDMFEAANAPQLLKCGRFDLGAWVSRPLSDLAVECFSIICIIASHAVAGCLSRRGAQSKLLQMDRCLHQDGGGS